MEEKEKVPGFAAAGRATTIEELIEMRSIIDRELASRKATLQKQLAQLGGIRPTRAPRSDKGQKRKPADLEARMAAALAAELDSIPVDASPTDKD